MENSDPPLSINIDESGKISYKLVTIAEKQPLEFDFEIRLEEQKLHDFERLTRTVPKLDKRVKEQDKKINEQDKIIKFLEGKIKDELKIEFDASSTNIGYYTLVNSRRTAISKNDDTWRRIIAKNPLSKIEKVAFSVKIDYSTTGKIMVGICPTSKKYFTGYLFLETGCVCYNASSTGSVLNSGNKMALNFPTGLSGTIIKVITDLRKGKASFYFEDQLAHTATLDATIVLENDYYPYIDIYTTNERVSLLSYEVLV